MAATDKRDAEMWDRIVKLRDVTSKLRKAAEDVRAGVRAEKAKRERLESYILYWRHTHAEWSFNDVWDDKIRVFEDSYNNMEITSSDDEAIDGQ